MAGRDSRPPPKQFRVVSQPGQLGSVWVRGNIFQKQKMKSAQLRAHIFSFFFVFFKGGGEAWGKVDGNSWETVFLGTLTMLKRTAAKFAF